MSSTVIVTGVPRSGTSLQMQTLKLLGMEIVGEKFPKAMPGKNRAKSESLNPKGFFEDRKIVMRGVRDQSKLLGKAVKIIVGGLPERLIKRKVDGKIKNIPIGTIPEILDSSKIILCLRDPLQVAESQTNLISSVQIANNDFEDISEFMPENPDRYVIEMGRFYLWLKKVRTDLESKMLKVDFDDMHKDPEAQIDRIISFVGITCTPEQRSSAINNISGSLRRSVNIKEWGPSYTKTGSIATKLYRYFRHKEMMDDKILEDFFRNKLLENTAWVDTEYGLWIKSNPILHRQLSENLMGVYDKLRDSHSHKKNPTSCAYFEYSSEEYSVNRPQDIGTLTRKKISCKKDSNLKTIEQCYLCFKENYV